MKKTKKIAFGIALLFLGIYIISNLGVPMRYIQEKRARMAPAFWSERIRYGDLYSFSGLAAFKSEVEKDRNALRPHPLSDLPRDIDLYAICDSYLTDNFVKSNLFFSRVDRYLQVNLYLDKPAVISLNPKKINVLLIEKTEREVQEMLTSRLELLTGKISVSQPPGVTASPSTGATAPVSPDPPGFPAPPGPPGNPGIWKKTADALFNPRCNDNLQELLFDNQLFTGLRELKAQMNSRFFGRISPDVVIASDKRHLLYEKTVNPDSAGVSSFAPLRPSLVDTLAQTLTNVAATYRTKGFDYVFLSIIPSTATILEKNNPGYNRLIPLLYSHPALKIHLIDVYGLFRDTPVDIFAKGDTHWNAAGFYLWLDTFNAALEGLPNN
jgi:hypothetical protein